MERLKKTYAEPLTTVAQVELEGGLCATSGPGAEFNNAHHIEVSKQTDGGSADFSNEGWD